MRTLLLVIAVMACRPAPVINPNKPTARTAGPVVARDLTGQIAPDGAVLARDGTSFELARLWEASKVVVVFYRGGWCPPCQRQLAMLHEQTAQLAELGATVVAISSDSVADAAATRAKLGLGFELYADPELAVITRWGGEDFGAGIARPATFVVEPGGAISYRKVGENPADHPTMDELLAAVRAHR